MLTKYALDAFKSRTPRFEGPVSTADSERPRSPRHGCATTWCNPPALRAAWHSTDSGLVAALATAPPTRPYFSVLEGNVGGNGSRFLEGGSPGPPLPVEHVELPQLLAGHPQHGPDGAQPRAPDAHPQIPQFAKCRARRFVDLGVEAALAHQEDSLGAERELDVQPQVAEQVGDHRPL